MPDTAILPSVPWHDDPRGIWILFKGHTVDDSEPLNMSEAARMYDAALSYTYEQKPRQAAELGYITSEQAANWLARPNRVWGC